MNFKFKKNYGQNFLKDKSVIYDIVDSIYPSENDLIIEIGPGAGALTKCLRNYNATLLCIEIDEDTKEYLLPLENDKTHIIYDDFMKIDVKNLLSNYNYEKLYIIGNLPYYITTPIITKIIESNLDVETMTFMVQKEVADRFSASVKTRDYGSITVFLNYYFNVEKLFNVNKNKFYPVPKVDSAVIRFNKKELEVEANDMELFNKIVKNSFQYKRKNLRNNLKAFDEEQINNILNDFGYSLDNRAEDIPYNVFIEIANNYKK